MIDKIDSVVNAIGGFLYQPYIVPLFLIVAGLYFTIRTGLIQFRLFGESIHVVAEKPKEKGSISSFGALMVSTASRVGTGNIVGVSTAICLGGFGAGGVAPHGKAPFLHIFSGFLPVHIVLRFV